MLVQTKGGVWGGRELKKKKKIESHIISKLSQRKSGRSKFKVRHMTVETDSERRTHSNRPLSQQPLRYEIVGGCYQSH